MTEPIVQEIDIEGAPERIFDALTDPAQVKQWWGTETTYQVANAAFDLRVGGAWEASGSGNDGSFVVRGEYREIDRPSVLAYTWVPDWDPYETLVRFDLAPTDAGTRLTLTHSGFQSATDRVLHDAGWRQVLGWLRKYVQSP